MMTRIRRLERWQRTLLIVFFAQLCSATGFSLIFPFLPLYIEDLGSSTGLSVEVLSGLVISAQAVTMMIAAPIWGAVADRYGRKLMMARATFGGAVLLLLMGVVQSAEQLILVRAIQGLITGTMAAANALVAAEAPRDKTGFAMSVTQVGLWAGISTGPLIGGLLAEAYGFRLPFAITSFLLLLAGLLIWFGVQEDFEPVVKTGPGKMGFVAEWRHVIGRPGIAPTYSTRFLTGLARNLISPIAPLFIASLMVSEVGVSSTTGLIVGVSAATGTLGAVVLGRLGDRIGHRRILIFSALGAAVFYLPQSLATAAWQLLFLQGLAGFCNGGIVAAPSALLAQYTPQGEEGAVYGLDNSVWSGARAISPMIGSSVSVMLGMRSVFAFAGVLYLVTAVVGYLLLPHPKAVGARRGEVAESAAR